MAFALNDMISNSSYHNIIILDKYYKMWYEHANFNLAIQERYRGISSCYLRICYYLLESAGFALE